MKDKFTIIGLGELLWDVFEHEKRLGGAPANVAFHTNQIGNHAKVLSKIGNDELGAETLEWLDEQGIDKSLVETGDHPTGSVNIRLDSNRSAQYEFASNVAWDHLSATPELITAMSGADAVCFGTLAQRSPQSQEAVAKLVSATRMDALRVLDLNLRAPFYNKNTIVQSLQLANVLKINDEELAILSSCFDLNGKESEKLQTLARKYELQAIALTKGSEGYTLLRGVESYVNNDTLEISVADTVGAGDSFTAAFIDGLLQGYSLSEIGSYASRLAAYVCTQRGATPQIPHFLLPRRLLQIPKKG